MKEKELRSWKRNYTLVLVMNALYILIFYFIMQYFS